MSAPVRVFLLDDHEIVRRGVAEVLSAVAARDLSPTAAATQLATRIRDL